MSIVKIVFFCFVYVLNLHGISPFLLVAGLQQYCLVHHIEETQNNNYSLNMSNGVCQYKVRNQVRSWQRVTAVMVVEVTEVNKIKLEGSPIRGVKIEKGNG